MMTHEPQPNTHHHSGPGREDQVGLSRVLVATDFSPESACALTRALQLPLRQGAEILLVHALPPAAAAGRPDEEEALARHALEVAEQHARTKRARAAFRVRSLLVKGLPSETLSQAARNFGAELIVMGRPRRPGSLLARIRERMTGGLIESIPTALLIVGPPPICEYRRPLVAVDFTQASRHAMEAVFRMCPGASRVAVLHDYDTSYEFVLHQSAAPLARILEYQREARARALAELHRFLEPYRDSGVDFDELVLSGDAPASIVELAHAENADLVIVGRHMRAGLGRLVRPHVAQQVTRESTCDVLILEQEPPEAPPSEVNP
ncbi:universal stress protein [Archangium gephyra]|uniref:universal stress protein n=1 Tax=Archangium gephyra TaxID=48 RepID=UPI003B793813